MPTPDPPGQPPGIPSEIPPEPAFPPTVRGDGTASGAVSPATAAPGPSTPIPALIPAPAADDYQQWPDGFDRVPARRRNRKHGGVAVQVTRRLLFLGDSTYPLQHVSRVRTVVVEPDRWVPAGRFLTWLGLCVGAVLLIFRDGRATGGEELLLLAALVTACVAVHHGVRTVAALFAKARYLLIVETTGAPKAVIPGRKPEQMRDIRLRILHAIDEPDTEFRMTVETLVIGDPKMYHISNEVNMLDGTGNKGVVIS